MLAPLCTNVGFNTSTAYAGRDKPIILDNLTYARLAHEQWRKVVMIQTIIKAPQGDAPTTDESGTTEQNNEEKFIKPYLVKPRFDKRIVGMRHTYSGTGFACGVDAGKQKTFICTNAHIVKGGSEIIVITASETEYRAAVLVEDMERDVAVLAIESKEDLSPIVWGDSNNTVVGEAVIAIGHPQDFFYSLSRGIVSAKRFLPGVKDKPSLPFLQLDMTLNLGNSGSPVFNMGGEVVGVAEGIAQNGQGIAFAIPSNDFRKIIENVKMKQIPAVPSVAP